MSTAADEERRAFLAAYGPAVASLAEEAAALIERTIPSARWAVRRGWQCLACTHPDVGYFCGVFPRSDSVQVGFEFGVLLPDPHGVLSGSGSQLRYVMLAPGEPLPEAALVGLLEAAVTLPPNASARRSMAKARRLT